MSLRSQALSKAQEYIFEQANGFVAESIGVDPNTFVEAVKEGWERQIFKKADLLAKYRDEQCEEALLQASLSAMDAGLDHVSDAAENAVVSAFCEELQEALAEIDDPFDVEVTALKMSGVAIGSLANLFTANRHVEGAQKTCVMNMTGQSILIKTYGANDGVRAWAYGRWAIADGQIECIEAPPGQNFSLAIWIGSEMRPRHYFDAEAKTHMYYCVTPTQCRNIPIKFSVPTASENFPVTSNTTWPQVGDSKDGTYGFSQKGVYRVGEAMSEADAKAGGSAMAAEIFKSMKKKPKGL